MCLANTFLFAGIFFSDDFVENILTKRIADKWYEIGIYLGLPCSMLGDWHDLRSKSRGSRVSFITMLTKQNVYVSFSVMFGKKSTKVKPTIA